MRNRVLWSLVGPLLAFPLFLLAAQGPSLLFRVVLGVEALAIGLLLGWFPQGRGPSSWQRWVLRWIFVVLSLGALVTGAWSERRAVTREQHFAELVDEVTADAAPAHLAEPQCQTQRSGGSHTTRLVFPRSKNEPLGELVFHAEVAAGNLRISSFGPPSGSGFVTRGKGQSVNESGSSASTRYSLLGAVDPVLILTASGSESIRIEGNKLPAACDIALP